MVKVCEVLAHLQGTASRRTGSPPGGPSAPASSRTARRLARRHRRPPLPGDAGSRGPPVHRAPRPRRKPRSTQPSPLRALDPSPGARPRPTVQQAPCDESACPGPYDRGRRHGPYRAPRGEPRRRRRGSGPHEQLHEQPRCVLRPPEHASTASAVHNMFRQLGATFGVAGIGIVVAATTNGDPSGTAYARGVTDGMLAVAVAAGSQRLQGRALPPESASSAAMSAT